MPRGGKRPGAGRKPTKLSRVAKPLKKTQAEEILASRDEISLWNELLDARTTISIGKGMSVEVPDLRLRFDVAKYLTDRRDGKPPQKMQLETPGEGVKILLVGEKHV